MSAQPAIAGPVTAAVRSPRWVLFYQGVNITARIERMIRRITYQDHGSNASDEVEVELEDRDKRWQGPWFPAEGDRLNLQIGYDGEALLNCGDFQVDEVELNGPPDVVTMRCLAASIKPAMRTPNTNGYENQTLIQIATQIASKYGLNVVASPDAINVSFDRVTQLQETDLAFLRRLANDHNYDFTVRGNNLVFYSRTALEQTAPVLAIVRGQTPVKQYEFKSRTQQIYKAAEVSYFNPDTKALVTGTATASPAPPTGDTLKLQKRCANGQVATLKAQASLHDHNMLQVTGKLTLSGTIVLRAMKNVTVQGWGDFDGTYHMDSARHTLERPGGYTTEIEIRSVNDASSDTPSSDGTSDDSTD